MQIAVWIVLAVVVAFVVFDACARPAGAMKPRQRDGDQALISTQKIIVDLTKRH
jgi:hypothetical protein